MLILLTIILLSLWMVIMANVYSIFNPFVQTLWDVKDYNVAYYGAISSIERANLAIRQHSAWFEWTWWWMDWSDILDWPDSDNNPGTFWKLSKNTSWMYWNIKSRIVWSIPEAWGWNIEPQLQWVDSINYNKLEYFNAQEFVLTVDKSVASNAYQPVNSANVDKIWDIMWTPVINLDLRLPQKIYSSLNKWLNESHDLDWDWVQNDIVVNRSLFGEDWSGNDFTVLPNISQDYNAMTYRTDDSAIRERNINNWISLAFGNNINPLHSDPNSPQNTLEDHYIIPSNNSFINNDFSTILNDWDNLHLKLSLVNKLITNDNNLFPFVEYKVDFGWATVSDRHFHITWVWKVWNYNVSLNFSKPVVESNSASDFTILF